jgi:energy-coupling factor transporter ATP-binding protein EcfA2
MWPESLTNPTALRPGRLDPGLVHARSSRSYYQVSQAIAQALETLVFDSETLAQIGTAIGSGRSVFLYGPPGNGKSTIAEQVAAMLTDEILIPYAVEAFGHSIRVTSRVKPSRSTVADHSRRKRKTWKSPAAKRGVTGAGRLADAPFRSLAASLRSQTLSFATRRSVSSISRRSR